MRDVLTLTVMTLLLSFSTAIAEGDAGEEEVTRPGAWTEISHGRTARPDYDLVFSQDSVSRLDIVFDPEEWQIMMDDMTELCGEFGEMAHSIEGDGSPPPRPPDGPPHGLGNAPLPPQGMPFPAGAGPGGAGGHGLSIGGDRNPVWVQATILFNGMEWTHVGVRFKGNSSLAFTWGEGVMKLPMKLDFDEFESDFPEVRDQRFFGFRQLTLSSNFMDSSLLREKVTADIFRAAGVPAPHTAFYRIYVDNGGGPVYFGLYTMVEVVDDTVIEEQFTDDGGNVYKPEGRGATFAENSFNEVAFDKETNREEGDWNDILRLFDVLHSDLRTIDTPAWRRDLESLFDVDGFLLWLAANVIVQNWDTYGRSPHNYYLYNDPATGLLTWIPWDNNMALRSDKGLMPVLTLDLEDVNRNWPLIRYFMDDPVYREKYMENLEHVLETAFDPEDMKDSYLHFHDMISQFVIGENGELEGYSLLECTDEFNEALEELVDHASRRNLEVDAFLRL
ncbi:MAG: CotH kinase family protein [Candidatus Aegiribacteria sp.]|nr:CotH kinase family protein [Candidatus Aegiribacteria sp.]